MNVTGADLLAVLAAGCGGSSFGSFLHVHEALLDASSAHFAAVRPAAPGLHPATCSRGEEQEATASEFTSHSAATCHLLVHANSARTWKGKKSANILLLHLSRFFRNLYFTWEFLFSGQLFTFTLCRSVLSNYYLRKTCCLRLCLKATNSFEI